MAVDAAAPLRTEHPTLSTSSLHSPGERLELSSPATATSVHHSASIVELYSDVETAHTTIVWPHLIPSLQRRAKREHLTTGRGGRAAGRSAREHDSSAHDRLGWIPLGGFRTETWCVPPTPAVKLTDSIRA